MIEFLIDGLKNGKFKNEPVNKSEGLYVTQNPK